ncbi:3-hydroxy-2-methylbutyryl-CoA dehydrogenase [Mycolicibacterium mucogenicum]|uniref:3-hydroxy-2-methylbutyryl-CoA dehydrogenase n=1 Tax=Mycolicibacterium mucogenicum TaxID=56689 RepID=A0A1A3HFT1_MYCMU|nr:SDR family NAD(P)-dependent oxidoreductase [Mycolicibacterium mucogenicum]OBJ46441.1 3-hydroxy-2-methylbutyryl-CoA dehydrogenase [Mycolicibacterium mucogenicum]
MHINGISALVTGGASGLGKATVEQLLRNGAAHVTIVDLPTSNGQAVADELGANATFVPADVANAEQMKAAIAIAAQPGPLRAVVHCAGRGAPLRVIAKDGTPAELDVYTEIIRINLIGTFNVLRLAAAQMATNEPLDGDRGVVVLTASVAAFEGQIGQAPYASAKAGIVGLTLVAARDLATHAIRVCTIAPGTFDTPLLAKLPENMRHSLAASVPHPSRLGIPDEYAHLAASIIENGMLNGETIRLDGAIRMPPR